MEQSAPYHEMLHAHSYFLFFRLYLHQISVQYNQVNRKNKATETCANNEAIGEGFLVDKHKVIIVPPFPCNRLPQPQL